MKLGVKVFCLRILELGLFFVGGYFWRESNGEREFGDGYGCLIIEVFVFCML